MSDYVNAYTIGAFILGVLLCNVVKAQTSKLTGKL